MRQPGRRQVLRLACAHCLGAGALGSVMAAAHRPDDTPAPPAPPGLSEMPGRFSRPAIESEEGGLWAQMDRAETRLRRSPFLVRDPKLNAYLDALLCRLAGEHCQDIRIHVVRTPVFNALMAPNGMMQVWSGLLLRVDNEAQLAAILGHELAHYLERHALEQLRDSKGRAAFAQMAAMFGAVGLLAQVGAMAGMFAFSREQETRADRLGMRLMRKAGYDGQQAALVWEHLLGELKVTGGEDVGRRSPMMATHPPTQTRRDDLSQLAGTAGGATGEAAFREATQAFRFSWLLDEIRRGQYEESLVLFNRLLSRAPDDAELLYARGEVLRLRGDAADLDKAADDLTRASASPGAPAQAARSLGLVHRQRAQVDAAIQAFQKYLQLAPDASDAALVKSYLSELRP